MGRKKSKRPEIVSRWQTYHGKGDLADWQRLMQDLGISGDFRSKAQCRKVSKGPDLPSPLREKPKIFGN